MAKKKKQQKTAERVEYFTALVDTIVDQIDDDLLNHVHNYYKENDVKFKMPTHLCEHTIVDLYEPINLTDRVTKRCPKPDDLREFVRILADAAIFTSEWYNGISENGAVECEGPCIVRFNPQEKNLQFCFIDSMFLWVSDLDPDKSEFDSKTKIMNDLIVKDTVDYMAKWSVANGEYGFELDEKYDNVYERVNAAIENLVEQIDLKEIGGIWHNGGGLILVNSGVQIWFMFSPLFTGMTASITDMPNYHSKEDLDRWKLA